MLAASVLLSHAGARATGACPGCGLGNVPILPPHQNRKGPVRLAEDGSQHRVPPRGRGACCALVQGRSLLQKQGCP